MSAQQTTAEQRPVTEADYTVSGMTCGSCAARVERTLAHHPGVQRAGVNFATGRARVVFDREAVSSDDLEAAVVRIGYGLAPLQDLADSDSAAVEARAQRAWLRRVAVAWPLGLAVLALLVADMTVTWVR